MLAERHQVVTVDLQGHGRTADIDRPMDVRLMAGDIAALIEHLGLDKPDVVGYSLGVVSHCRRRSSTRRRSAGRGRLSEHPARRDLFGDAGAAGPGERGRRRVHERNAHVPVYQRVRHVPRTSSLLTKIGESMSKDFDYAKEVRGLQVPTLIVAADADMAPPSHYVEVFKLLGGGLRDGGWMGEGRPKGGHALAILPA